MEVFPALSRECITLQGKTVTILLVKSCSEIAASTSKDSARQIAELCLPVKHNGASKLRRQAQMELLQKAV